MIVLLKKKPGKDELANLVEWFRGMGLDVHVSEGEERTLLGLIGDTSRVDIDLIKALDIVDNVKRIQEPFKNANRKFHPDDSVIDLGGTKIGGGNFQIIAGPCSVETEEQICSIAREVKQAGATMLRGGAFKPRTSPYSFQGMGLEGLELLLEAKAATGLPIVTEIMNTEHLPLFENVDLIQVGARNMQNFDLLKELGQVDRPILLKRGLNATYEEWIMSAEYIMASGNENVILCERGIRTFETFTRNTLDLQCIPVLRSKTHLPIIIDPSHAGGKWWLVEPMAKAAVAAGADGLMIEVHNNPETALCDGAQSLKPEKYDVLLQQVRQIAEVVGKKF